METAILTFNSKYDLNIFALISNTFNSLISDARLPKLTGNITLNLDFQSTGIKLNILNTISLFFIETIGFIWPF